MVNFRVVRIGDMIKNLVKIGILIICILSVTRFFKLASDLDLKSVIEDRKKDFNEKTFIECLDENLEDDYIRNKKSNENFISKEFESVILSFSKDVVSDEKNSIAESVEQDDVIITGTTAVVQENNKEEIYNTIYSTVKVRNQTSMELTQEMLTPDIEFNKNNIIIFHTHTSESYTPTENFTYEASRKF